MLSSEILANLFHGLGIRILHSYVSEDSDLSHEALRFPIEFEVEPGSPCGRVRAASHAFASIQIPAVVTAFEPKRVGQACFGVINYGAGSRHMVRFSEVAPDIKYRIVRVGS